MIRAFFFSIGLFATLCGAALSLVDQVVLTDYAGRKLRETAGSRATDERPAESHGWRLLSVAHSTNESPSPRQVVDPPDWGGFGLLSIGGVTLLYSLALPGRRRDDDEA